MCLLKKQYDDMVTEYNIEYRKYNDNMKARMMNVAVKSEDDDNANDNNGSYKGTMDGKYDARAFIDELLKEMEDLYLICSAILDEMDRGKEMHEKLSVEIQKCEQADTILLMMDAIKVDDFHAIETITGKVKE